MVVVVLQGLEATFSRMCAWKVKRPVAAQQHSRMYPTPPTHSGQGAHRKRTVHSEVRMSGRETLSASVCGTESGVGQPQAKP